ILLPILAVTLLALAPLDIPLWVRIALIVAAALGLALTSTALGLASSETLLRTLLERVQTITDAFHEGYGGRSRDIVTPALATRDMAIADAQGSRALILGAPTVARIVQGLAFIVWCTFGYGFTISPLLLFGIYALSRLLALIPLTPGGIGVIDVGVAWALVQCGAPNAAAVSCALTFTLSQVLTPVVAGALAIPVSVHDSRADIARRSS
ncbi:MAG: lysylphosphatidylglycerol synthase domain-containing protein, partial [Dermabacter sp.]|nr:lysylphosphatidylglycerol synthase domain-containing protein [Dermabacter sp.]